MSTKFKSFEGKQDNKSQGCLFRWLFKNQWVYLSRWYAKLGLTIEGDGLKIHDFNNGQESTWQKNVKPYYNVYVWINIVNDYAILKAFQIISQMKNNKNTDCNVFEMFLNIL